MITVPAAIALKTVNQQDCRAKPSDGATSLHSGEPYMQLACALSCKVTLKEAPTLLN